MVTTGPLRAMGPSTTLTLEPFSSLASTIGEVSFTTLLQPATICCMTSCSFSPDSKPQGQAKSLPALSTKIPSIPLIIISVTCSSSISSCSTSKPRMVKNSSSLLAAGQDVLTILEENLDNRTVLNLQGCTLDMVLYYPDREIPVLAVMQDGSAVLVIGFNEQNVVLMDPLTGTVYKKGMNDARSMFEENGNRFIAYS